jgi:hypothetical protein
MPETNVTKTSKVRLLMKMIRYALFFLTVLPLLVVSSGKAQSTNLDPGHKETVSLGELQFSCPKEFNLQRQAGNETLAYMQHKEYELALFVTTPTQKVDSESIKQLAGTLAAHLLPKAKSSYKWKRLDAYQMMSQFENGGEQIQGFNGKQRLSLQYRKLQFQGKEIVVGYLFTLGETGMDKELFERNLGGDSMAGSYAQAHIIASITKEKFDSLTKGGLISAPPPPRR